MHLPYVVGADWFQYYDEPPHGRKLDGEDYNFGLVDIHDRRTRSDCRIRVAQSYRRSNRRRRHAKSVATAGVPPARPTRWRDFQPMTAIKIGTASAVSFRRQRNIRRAIFIFAGVPMHFILPHLSSISSNRITIKIGEIPDVTVPFGPIRIDGGPPITARIGAGKDAVMSNPAIRIMSLSGTYHDVRCITAIEVAAQVCSGKIILLPGDQIT